MNLEKLVLKYIVSAEHVLSEVEIVEFQTALIYLQYLVWRYAYGGWLYEI